MYCDSNGNSYRDDLRDIIILCYLEYNILSFSINHALYCAMKQY